MATAQDLLRKRFHEVQVEKEAILAKIAPKQQEFDALSDQINFLEMQKDEIHLQHLKPEKDKIFELDNELGLIAKSLREGEFKSRLGDRDEFLTLDEIKAIQAKVV